MSPTAKVTVDGKPAKLEDLRVGRRIQVVTDETGHVMEVATVDLKKSA